MKKGEILTFALCLVANSIDASTFEVYGELAGKTILRPSSLPRIPDSVLTGLPVGQTNTVAFLERVFATNGIAVIPDGPKFVRLLPENRREVFLRAVPLRGEQIDRGLTADTNVSGIVNCLAVDATTLLNLYAAVRQRTVLRPTYLPSVLVSLKARGTLTVGEVGYAMETVLGLNGIALVDDGEKLVQAVPWEERTRVKTGAPKPDPAAKLLDPNRIPSLGLATALKPLSPMEHDFERFRKAVYDFVNYKEPRDDKSAGRLLRLYGVLANKTVVKSANFDGAPVWFHIETPLARNELLYAIEATFALDNMAIIQVDNGTIRLGHITELKQGSADVGPNYRPVR